MCTLSATEGARCLNHNSTVWLWPRRDGTASSSSSLMNAIDDREAQKTNFGRRRTSRKWRRGVVDDLDGEELSRAVRWYNSRSDIRRSSLAIRSRLKPEVTRLPGEACVSAIFGITFLMVLFPSDLDGVVGFWIGGLVR